MFLKTARTYLRPFIQEDYDKLCALCTSFEAMQYIPPHFSAETKKQVKDRLNFYIRHYEEHGISFCYVSDKNGNFIGRAGFCFVPEVNYYEVGFSLLPEYWGQGYATELVQSLLDYAFNTLNLDAVCARSIIGNFNSERVLYKTGFSYLGERAFSIKDQVFVWNYFEIENDRTLNLSENKFQSQTEDWDVLI